MNPCPNCKSETCPTVVYVHTAVSLDNTLRSQQVCVATRIANALERLAGCATSSGFFDIQNHSL